MKKIMFLSAVMGSLISVNAFAHNIQPNQFLANVTVSDKGEITLNGNDVAYKSWSSTALPGKVRVIQHIAGRSAAKEKNQAMIEAIKAAHFNQAKYQTTTIINADDAVVGTGMFVKSSAEKGKKENAHSQVILDDKSAVKNQRVLVERYRAEGKPSLPTTIGLEKQINPFLQAKNLDEFTRWRLAKDKF